MKRILGSLIVNARENAQIWIVVATSAYAGMEVSVDIILGRIGERVGFKLLNIIKLREIKSERRSAVRGTHNSTT